MCEHVTVMMRVKESVSGRSHARFNFWLAAWSRIDDRGTVGEFSMMTHIEGLLFNVELHVK